MREGGKEAGRQVKGDRGRDTRREVERENSCSTVPPRWFVDKL